MKNEPPAEITRRAFERSLGEHYGDCFAEFVGVIAAAYVASRDYNYLHDDVIAANSVMLARHIIKQLEQEVGNG